MSPARSRSSARTIAGTIARSVTRTIARTIACAVSVALGGAPLTATPLSAQQLRPGLLVGRVVDVDGAGVSGVVLRATQGARTILAYAEVDGDFRLGGLGGGIWTFSIRRLGFRPLAVDVELPGEGLRRNFTIERSTTALDPVLVSAKWSGVRGVVGDARRITALAGASVRLLGSDATVGTDSSGNFALPLPGGRDVVLRVERAGFATRLVSASVPAEGYVELEIPLDTVLRASRDYWIWRDLDERLKFATPRAVQVSREEIAASDAVSLGAALALSRSVARLGVRITRRACVFVNGIAKPGYPVDAIDAGNVEFVEAYPPGSDLTRTLVMRWPPGGECGVPDGTSRTSTADSKQTAQFVSVWLRAP